MIRCIKEGKPVPGVREIPDTILRDPVSFPLSFFSFLCFACSWVCMGWDVFSLCCVVCKAIRVEAGA